MNETAVIEARNRCLGRLIVEGYRIRETLPDGRIVIEDDKNEYTVHLDNTVRNMVREGNDSPLDSLLRSLKSVHEPLPEWETARSGLRLTAERADQDLDGVIHEEVTEEIACVLAYVSPDEGRIRWLTASDLNEWGVSFDHAYGEAVKNMDALIDGMKLALLETRSPLKASLIFSPGLKAKVEPELGWPIYAVVPCRDFAYLFRAEALIPRLGGVVVREYNESGYPLSTEVLKLSDAGIGAVGAFSRRQPT
jgi:hypothetical protein